MGLLLLFLSLVSAGLVADLLIESGPAADRTLSMLGATLSLSLTEVVLGAFALGALAVVFAILGSRLVRRRRGCRREMRRRIATLETENAELRDHVESTEPTGVRRSA